MPTFQDFTSRPPAPELADLLARVDRLRRRSLQRPAEMPTAPWIKALGGRELAPGLVLAERRFPLWYRHDGRELLCITQTGTANGLCAGPQAEHIGFLSLLPALLDDGSPRLCLATWGRLEDKHFVIQQGLATGPGAEGALLSWLDDEMGKVEAVACGRGNLAWLAGADLRHGRQRPERPAFVASSRPGPVTPLTWRGLQSAPASRVADLYRRQRDSLLSRVMMPAGL